MNRREGALAIIPARGGSKGIPRKNVLLLAGKPLIAYTIEAALQANGVDRVVVSTDDPEIGAVARQYGAEVVWRPAEISGDIASSEAALLHVLETLEREEQYRPEICVFLQCTSPLTIAEDIEGTVQALKDDKADSALAVTSFHYFLWNSDGSGDAIGINHDKRERLMRQQREPQYLETGAIYVFRVEGFLNARRRFFGRTTMHQMPQERCHEIDEPVDFTVAEVLLTERRRQQASALLPQPVRAIIFDFDGVFTDNRVFVLEDGREAVVCSRGDGMAIGFLRQRNIPMLTLSKERNPVVAARCRKLGIECLHGIDHKLPRLQEWLETQGVPLASAVYVGNDVNDIECLSAVGCGVAVGDAYPEAKAAAKIVLSAFGGLGAIRELSDLIGLHQAAKS